MQLGSMALHPGEVPRSWSLLELHDHLDKLIFAGRIRASGETCHLGRDLLEHSPVSGLSIPRLRERNLRNQDQHQHAQALSPCGAMALPPACWLS
jgi:hypothetical protein